MTEQGDIEVLEKRLGLFDVYAICVGAMFASGFFFLPGVAAANAGPSVVLAYGISALLMIPAMFSIAELSSAMPRAGGAYFFIHRSLGPWVGMVGGVGLWLVLVLKSAFALVGMGAYLALFFDVPIAPLAVALTVAFGLLNTVGAKETAWLQNAFVMTLVPIMAYYLAAGLIHLAGQDLTRVHAEQFSPFMPFGTLGLVSTVGLVSISYAGLTKIASAAEEIRDLDRNLPLGMLLALLTAGAIYVGGVYVMVGSIDPAALRDDLTPVATAGEAFLQWLPGSTGLVLVVVAAIAAFASTGNAGVLTASRYPLAMARDTLVWRGFERLGRFGTPTVAIAVTCAVMIAAILFLDVERLAKLGSAFILLTFALINLAVIIMRESRIEAYAPGYRSPGYPWVQIIGVITMLGLIATLGLFATLFVIGIVLLATGWYRFYAKGRVTRQGAIYRLFRRLSDLGEPGVDLELWRLLQERGTSAEDAYEALVAGGRTLDLGGPTHPSVVLDRVAAEVADDIPLERQELRRVLSDAAGSAITPTGSSAVLTEALLDDLDRPVLVLVRVDKGVHVSPGQEYPGHDPDDEYGAEAEEPVGDWPADAPAFRSQRAHALIFLLSPADVMTQHLRVLAELATQVEAPDFARRWRDAGDGHELKEVLLRHEWFITLDLDGNQAEQELSGRQIQEVDWPERSIVALVRRNGRTIFPHGNTQLQVGDRLTVIGPPDEIDALRSRLTRA